MNGLPLGSNVYALIDAVFFVCLLMGASAHVTLLGVSGGICAGIYSPALSLIRPTGARLMPGHIFLGFERYAERMHIVCTSYAMHSYQTRHF